MQKSLNQNQSLGEKESTLSAKLSSKKTYLRYKKWAKYLLITIALIPLFSTAACSFGEKEEEPKAEEPAIEEPATEAKNPIVTIEMESGNIIKAELKPEYAPNTVSNFISLVEQGFYDGLIFHRVIPNFMIQGGCPQGSGMGNPGYSIKGEFSTNGYENNLQHEKGVLSMARSQHPDSAGSQFFIMVAAAPHLDGGYAAFGKVITGMEEVDRIVGVTSQNDRPLEEQRIKKVTVDTFGVEFPPVEKIKP